MHFLGKIFFVLSGYNFGVNEYSCVFFMYIFGAKKTYTKKTVTVEEDPYKRNEI